MFKEDLQLVYLLFFDRTARKVNWLERYLGITSLIALSDDERMSELHAYRDIFSADCRPCIEQLYAKLLDELKTVSYDQSGEIIEALAFVQEISATALWKYHLEIGQRVEKFVKDFDRLDVSTERIRLYEFAKLNSPFL